MSAFDPKRTWGKVPQLPFGPSRNHFHNFTLCRKRPTHSPRRGPHSIAKFGRRGTHNESDIQASGHQPSRRDEGWLGAASLAALGSGAAVPAALSTASVAVTIDTAQAQQVSP